MLSKISVILLLSALINAGPVADPCLNEAAKDQATRSWCIQKSVSKCFSTLAESFYPKTEVISTPLGNLRNPCCNGLQSCTYPPSMSDIISLIKKCPQSKCANMFTLGTAENVYANTMIGACRSLGLSDCPAVIPQSTLRRRNFDVDEEFDIEHTTLLPLGTLERRQSTMSSLLPEYTFQPSLVENGLCFVTDSDLRFPPIFKSKEANFTMNTNSMPCGNTYGLIKCGIKANLPVGFSSIIKNVSYACYKQDYNIDSQMTSCQQAKLGHGSIDAETDSVISGMYSVFVTNPEYFRHCWNAPGQVTAADDYPGQSLNVQNIYNASITDQVSQNVYLRYKNNFIMTAGCYFGPSGFRILNQPMALNQNLSMGKCSLSCIAKNFMYSEVGEGNCWCGNFISPIRNQIKDLRCTNPCIGAPKERCGGQDSQEKNIFYHNVYKLQNATISDNRDCSKVISSSMNLLTTPIITLNVINPTYTYPESVYNLSVGKLYFIRMKVSASLKIEDSASGLITVFDNKGNTFTNQIIGSLQQFTIQGITFRAIGTTVGFNITLKGYSALLTKNLEIRDMMKLIKLNDDGSCPGSFVKKLD